MQRKQLLVIVVLLWLSIILIPLGITIVHSLQGYHIRQEYTLPSSFTAVSPFGADSVVFSNGQALETYNYTNGQTLSLSPSAGLAIIDTMSTSQNRYIAFHDGQVLQTGSLAGQLNAQGLASTSDYWWVFDTQSRAFQPLPQNTLIAKLYNGKLYALEYSNAGESINTYQLPGLQQVASLAVQGSSDFSPTPNGFLLETANNQVLFTSNGAVNQVLLGAATLVGVTGDGQSAVAVSTQNNTRSLVSIDTQTGSATTIASQISNLPVWLNTGTVLYTDTAGNMFSYNLTTKKSTQWKYGGNLGKAKKNVKLVALINPTTAVVNDGSNHYYLIGKGLAPVAIK